MVRWQVLERDNFTCQYCGQFAPNVLLEVDHKIAVVDGGTEQIENLITSCMACNRGKEAYRAKPKAPTVKPHTSEKTPGLSRFDSTTQRLSRLLVTQPTITDRDAALLLGARVATIYRLRYRLLKTTHPPLL